MSSSRRNTTSKASFEYELTQKQEFFLIFHQLGLALDIIKSLWSVYRYQIDQDSLKYHIDNCPYKNHPAGNDSLFKSVGGFIDPDIFLDYYIPRESYLLSIKMIGHSWFFSQIDCEKDEIENRSNYFTHLINQPLIKLRKLHRARILEKVIQHLRQYYYHLSMDHIMRYIWSLYTMYKNNRVLCAYPICIDNNNELLRFE